MKKKWNFKDSYYVGDTVQDVDYIYKGIVIAVTSKRLVVKTPCSTREYSDPESMDSFIKQVKVLGNINYTLRDR